MISGTISDLAALSPAIGALVIVALFGYLMITKLLDILQKHSEAMSAMSQNISANTSVTKETKDMIQEMHKFYIKNA